MLRITRTPKPDVERRHHVEPGPDIMLGRAVMAVAILVICFLIYGVIKLNQ